MARHFLQLYLLIVATVAAASWAQGKLWETFAGRTDETAIAENRAQAAALTLVNSQLREIPRDDRGKYVAGLAARSGVNLELLEPRDIVGADTLARLAHGEVAHMRAANEDWLLETVAGDGRVLALHYSVPEMKRGVIDWTLAFLFYAAIALVIMAWLWPLTRDLRQLERSTTSFGDRAWKFDARIGARSPVYRLAEAFRRMAARIDSLIGAQKDMTNAMSHEIKTPLAPHAFRDRDGAHGGGSAETGGAPEPPGQRRCRARRVHHRDARLRHPGARRSGAERAGARLHADSAGGGRGGHAFAPGRGAQHSLRGFARRHAGTGATYT
ncbi:MAG: hypothetical protein WDO68_13825 [Gammaproteobacteria bacterium]